MVKQLRALLFILLPLLSACGPWYETQYTMVPPKTSEGRMCVAHCQQSRSLCRQGCQIDERSCRADARARALDDYHAYVHAQKAARKPIKKSPRDFEYAYGCGTSSCERECDADHRQCYSDCGGQVIAQRVCTMNCDQVPPRQSAPLAAAPSVQKMTPVPKGAGPYSPLCQPGQRVEVMSEGDWYEAVVKAPMLPDGRCPVHYEGYGEEDDEDVWPKSIRPLR